MSDVYIVPSWTTKTEGPQYLPCLSGFWSWWIFAPFIRSWGGSAKFMPKPSKIFIAEPFITKIRAFMRKLRTETIMRIINEMSAKRPILDNDTRWNSVFAMLERFLLQSPKVGASKSWPNRVKFSLQNLWYRRLELSWGSYALMRIINDVGGKLPILDNDDRWNLVSICPENALSNRQK